MELVVGQEKEARRLLPTLSGPVPSTREIKPGPVVKLEEGSKGSKGPAGERAGKFHIGAEVANKQAKPKEERE